MNGDVIQIALPVAALVIIGNIVLSVLNRRAVNSLNNGGLARIIHTTADGQKICQQILLDVKTSAAVQTEVLKDIRDTLKQMSSKL